LAAERNWLEKNWRSIYLAFVTYFHFALLEGNKLVEGQEPIYFQSIFWATGLFTKTVLMSSQN